MFYTDPNMFSGTLLAPSHNIFIPLTNREQRIPRVLENSRNVKDVFRVIPSLRERILVCVLSIETKLS